MWHPNVMNRVGFTKVARQLGCQLYIPFPGEQVAVLKTGLLLHIEAYMQVRVLLALSASRLPAWRAAQQPIHAGTSLLGHCFPKVQEETRLHLQRPVDVWSAQEPDHWVALSALHAYAWCRA